MTKQVAGKIKGELAQFRELAAFAQFGSDLDARTKAQLDRGSRIVELFKQPAFNPVPIEVQAAVLWAMQNNYFDAIDVKKIVGAANNLKEFLSTRKQALLDTPPAEGRHRRNPLSRAQESRSMSGRPHTKAEN